MPNRSLTIPLKGDTADVLKKMAGVRTDFDDLRAKFEHAALKIDVNDKLGKIKLRELGLTMDKLDRRIARPKVDLEGAERASLAVDKLSLKLDKLGEKTARPNVSLGGKLAGLLGGLGGGGGLPLGPTAIVAAIAGALALAPAAIPFGLGGIVGGGAAFAGLKMGSTAHTQMLQLQTRLRNITGSTASSNASRRHIEAQIAAFRQSHGTQLQLGNAYAGLTHNLSGAFLGALTSKSQGFSGGPWGHPGTSFFTGLTGILAQVGGFIKSIGPGLGNLFRASLPSLSAFVKIAEQLAKAVLPSMTQALKAITPDLPIIVQGFRAVSFGIAGFLTNLGPGMKASAIIFKTAMQVLGGILHATGSAAAGFAMLFVKSGETVRGIARGIPPFFDKMRHDIATIFDGVRHDFAFDWDQIWQSTIGAVIRGISTVVGWFHKLPASVQTALRGLGTMLAGIATGAMNMLLSGAKKAAQPIFHWFSGFAHGVMSIFHKVWSWFSPSGEMYNAGRDLMLGLDKGIKDHAGKVFGSVHAVGHNVVSWITQALKITHKPMSWLPALERLVSLESGGNPLARNPSGASGLFQTMPGTFAAYSLGGSMWNPVADAIAGIRYLSATYGSPWNIPNLFSGHYQGYKTGGIISEEIFGRGLRTGTAYRFGEGGVNERVSPLGAGASGGDTYNLTVNGFVGSEDQLALKIQKMLLDRKRALRS